MPIEYDPALIALSVAIAIQGGYVSLSLAHRLAHRSDGRRKAQLAASALSLGVGIWAMHFIGMLAVKLPLAVNYDVLMTLVSALVCVLVVGLGVFVASFGPLTAVRLATAGVLMGSGISIMHYIGMAALRANCAVSYSPPLIGASVAVGIAASTLALWLSFSATGRLHILAGAATMGIAISGMHYMAMAAATFLPVDVLVAISSPALSLDLLAIVVAVIAFMISGFFLLTLLPDRLGALPGKALVAAGTGGIVDAYTHTPSDVAPSAPPAQPTSTHRIPVTRNGTTLLLSPDQIYAIQADAHYTRIFDGTSTYFCGLSISELQARLNPETFLRVHRSHIVNVAHAAAVRRVRDQGVVELDSQAQYTVPVSRTRLPVLRTTLGI
ncbi:MAG: LytTR family transcriptional regulator DNA-binding domain-containing protein [Rhodospirillaceae bacterium]|nr:LytTR family transcriptional regulator DNA-binding domain-containing protein [Rhodospirillaceae bacterium]